MKNYKMWIGGKFVDAVSGKTFKAINPATEEEIAQVPLGDKEDIDKAVKAARKAFPVWSQKTQTERSKILFQMADAVREHGQELADIELADHGWPIRMARNMIALAADRLDTPLR
jgi:acyl-CoA reductase-like NAD-dependent aldehyde dehydrogenase